MTSSIIGFLSLGGMLGMYLFGLAADRRTALSRVSGDRSYLLADEERRNDRRAA
ncbi:MAG: hypothetical protein ABR564_08430 [Candidatus Dormibacteria bacterium]